MSDKRLAEIRDKWADAHKAEVNGNENCIEHSNKSVFSKAELSVHVNNIAQAKAALSAGADHIYLSGDVYEPDRPFTKAEIEELAAIKGNAKVYVALPRMMTELHFEIYGGLLSGERLPIDGVMVTNLGAIRKFASKGYPLVGDYNLNVYNPIAAQFYADYGVERLTASMELPLHDFIDLLGNTAAPLEAVVHGSPTVMYMEHDLYENTEAFEPIEEEDNHYVDNHILVLKTDKGENPVYRDANGRCHLTLAKELCLLPLVKELSEGGLSVFRIEGSTYKPEQLEAIVSAYRTALDNPDMAVGEFSKLAPVYAGYTLGVLQFNGGKTAEQGADKDAEKGTDKDTEQVSGKNMEQGAGKETEQGSGKETEQGTGKDTEQESGKETEQGSGKDTEQESGKDTEQGNDKEREQRNDKETAESETKMSAQKLTPQQV
ncbi:Peptidase family U32 [compost metagenome]